MKNSAQAGCRFRQITTLEKKTPQTAFDLENDARQLLIDRSALPEFSAIKSMLFHNPVYKTTDGDISMPLGLLIQMMTVSLRNSYLSRHPEIDK